MANAIFAVATLYSANEQRKGQKAQRKAQKVQGKRAAVENARGRRQQVAQAKRLRAQATAQADASGIGSGSQISGVQSSIGTQGASNVSFLNQLEGFDQARFSALNDASEHLSRAQTAGAVASIAGSPLGAEGQRGLTSFFKPA